MLIDLLGGAPALVAAGVAVYAAAVLHLVARDIERARWQRQFGGWRALQHDRIRRVAQPAVPFLVRFARLRPVRGAGCGWRAVQRHRIERAAVW
ncbi:MAG: hypothetical protein OXJ62_00485 [Spirochaetaceae bacterium]|nr:hypothetical protein [Spirochaetaceae bacterium]